MTDKICQTTSFIAALLLFLSLPSFANTLSCIKLCEIKIGRDGGFENSLNGQTSRSRRMLPLTHGENMWDYQQILKTPQEYLTRRGIPTTYGSEPWGGTNVQEILGENDFSSAEINLMKRILKMTQDKEIQKRVAAVNQWPKTEKRPANIPDDYFEVGGAIITLKTGEAHFLLYTSYERTLLSNTEQQIADFMKKSGIHLEHISLLQLFHNHPNGIPVLSTGDMAHKHTFLSSLSSSLGYSVAAVPTLHFYSFSEIDQILVVGHASHHPDTD